jgi:hypothetical protein
LNRLELSRPEPSRYHKISHDADAIETLFVDLFLDAHRKPPAQITLDVDATDDPLHGHQEGRFLHGYYDCYCYLPLYVFCGRHLLAARLRRADIDGAAGAVEEIARVVAQIRKRWPRVRILLRADSGFAREALMAWCEANRVDYLFGLAQAFWPHGPYNQFAERRLVERLQHVGEFIGIHRRDQDDLGPLVITRPLRFHSFSSSHAAVVGAIILPEAGPQTVNRQRTGISPYRVFESRYSSSNARSRDCLLVSSPPAQAR